LDRFFAVTLVGATSESEKLHFRILNRKDRLPVKSAYLDESTGKTVESEDIIKGYELDAGDSCTSNPMRQTP
jgi:DNA end-binding protein Ku